MLSLGPWDKKKGTFAKRTKETTAPYPPLNREALARVLDLLEKKYGGEDTKLKTLVQGENFGKLYAYIIEHIDAGFTYDLTTTTGVWKEYEQGSDPVQLSSSLKGYNTGWCIAGEPTARSYLNEGSIRVYCSEDIISNLVVPRLAVVEQHNRITEVRGIEENQNVDQHIQPILDEELDRLGEKGTTYRKASADMKRMIHLERKTENGEEFTQEDLRFLYEVDDEIQGFGYNKDPRIQKIIGQRDKRKDLASIHNCREDQISFTKEEALSGDIVYHDGDLDLDSLTSAEGLTLLKEIEGSLNLERLTSAEGLMLPKQVGGEVWLDSLTTEERDKLRQGHPHLSILPNP